MFERPDALASVTEPFFVYTLQRTGAEDEKSGHFGDHSLKNSAVAQCGEERGQAVFFQHTWQAFDRQQGASKNTSAYALVHSKNQQKSIAEDCVYTKWYAY